MSEKPAEPILYEAADFRIVLASNSFMFRVEGEAMRHSEAFESYEAAMRHIESRRKVADNETRQKISEAALTVDGNRVLITGLHSGHGKLLCSDKEYKGSEFYPDVPWIKEIIDEQRTIAQRLNEIRAKLRAVAVRREYSYGRVETAEQYNNIVTRFRSDWAKAVAEATGGRALAA